MTRKQGVRRLANMENYVDASLWGFEDYIKKKEQRMTTVTKNSTDFTKMIRITIVRKQKNNLMDISSDKQTKSHTRRPGNG